MSPTGYEGTGNIFKAEVFGKISIAYVTQQCRGEKSVRARRQRENYVEENSY